MLYYSGEKWPTERGRCPPSLPSRKRIARARCLEISLERSLEEVRGELKGEPHPRYVELPARPSPHPPNPRAGTHFVLAKREDLLQIDWMRHTLSLAGRAFRLPARQWERTALQIFRIARHFLRSRSLACDLPDVAAAVVSPGRYPWRVRNHFLLPSEEIIRPAEPREARSVRLNDQVVIRGDEVRFFSPSKSTYHRLDIHTLARRLLAAGCEQTIYERVVFAADPCGVGATTTAALARHSDPQTKFQETPLVSFIRFHSDDLTCQVMRFSLCPDGNGLIYVRRAAGPNLYLALTEPYDLLAALRGLSSSNTYARL